MRWILRIVGRVVLALMIAALVIYAGDWAVFAVRAHGGNGYDTVEVQQFLSTALKGNKQEFDYLGTAQIQCAKALFPHGGANPCWWQRRHSQVWE
jgi:hypothetical protein